MSSMNFTCDVCGREVFSCTFVNGMKFCAKCYQETFGETDKDRKIADLEAKLAESERKLEEYKKCNCKECMTDYEKNLNQIIDKFLNENIKLKQQLAEKEKERELDNSFWKQECDSLQKTLAEKEKEIESYKHFKITIGTMENNQVDISSTTYTDQDKISFALEQLEQLKKLCQEKFNWWENSEWEGDIYDKSDVSNAYFDIESNIDNQIKQLKEGK